MPKYKPRKPIVSAHSPTDDFPKDSNTIILDIERLADDGRGIGFYQGKTVFVAAALVGETVAVRLLKQTNKYSEACVTQLIQPSSHRIQAKCEYFDRCGGCTLQHMPADQQVSFKQEAVLSQLSRWAKIEPQEILPALSSHAYEYRQRVRLAVNYTKRGEVQLGFREADSHQIVNVSHCSVLKPSLQSTFDVIRLWIESIKPNNVSHVELVDPVERIGIVVRHTRKLPVIDRQALISALLARTVKSSSVCEFSLWFKGEKLGALVVIVE